MARSKNAIRCQIRKRVWNKPRYQESRVKFRTVLSKISAFPGQRGTIWESALISCFRRPLPLFLPPSPLSADSEGLRLTLTPLVLLQQLNAVVAVELDGPPVAVVADQQGALLQAALAVGLGGDSELCDVSGQVLLDRRTLRLWPGALQDASLSYDGGEVNGVRDHMCLNSFSDRTETSSRELILLKQ